jgi:hypothetical protein
VEDFTEFEQRTAYFNGDPIRAMKKGMNILDRIPVSHMAQMQNMLDFPPAPKLDVPAPLYLDDKMHDLKLERFLNEAPRGPIKAFTFRGIKDSPPYLHDGRALTLEDTVEFFGLVLGLQLSSGLHAPALVSRRLLGVRPNKRGKGEVPVPGMSG